MFSSGPKTEDILPVPSPQSLVLSHLLNRELIAAGVGIPRVEITAIGREAQRLDLGIELNGPPRLAAVRFPQPDFAIVAPRGKPAAVRTVGQAGHGFAMAEQLVGQLARGQVPDANRLDQGSRPPGAGPGGSKAVRRRPAAKAVYLLAVDEVPDGNQAIHAAGGHVIDAGNCQEAALGVKGHGVNGAAIGGIGNQQARFAVGNAPQPDVGALGAG